MTSDLDAAKTKCPPADDEGGDHRPHAAAKKNGMIGMNREAVDTVGQRRPQGWGKRVLGGTELPWRVAGTSADSEAPPSTALPCRTSFERIEQPIRAAPRRISDIGRPAISASNLGWDSRQIGAGPSTTRSPGPAVSGENDPRRRVARHTETTRNGAEAVVTP